MKTKGEYSLLVEFTYLWFLNREDHDFHWGWEWDDDDDGVDSGDDDDNDYGPTASPQSTFFPLLLFFVVVAFCCCFLNGAVVWPSGNSAGSVS